MESLPAKRLHSRSESRLVTAETRWHKAGAAVFSRPRSSQQLQPGHRSPHSLRSLPSAEFLRMLGSDHQLHSPITPLSFELGRGRRGGGRPGSPDLLRRSSPDLSCGAGEPGEQPICSVRASPAITSEGSDYAPVSTEEKMINIGVKS